MNSFKSLRPTETLLFDFGESIHEILKPICSQSIKLISNLIGSIEFGILFLGVVLSLGNVKINHSYHLFFLWVFILCCFLSSGRSFFMRIFELFKDFLSIQMRVSFVDKSPSYIYYLTIVMAIFVLSSINTSKFFGNFKISIVFTLPYIYYCLESILSYLSMSDKHHFLSFFVSVFLLSLLNGFFPDSFKIFSEFFIWITGVFVMTIVLEKKQFFDFLKRIFNTQQNDDPLKSILEFTIVSIFALTITLVIQSLKKTK